jgi:sensor histidine kinase regulating citrate/malate metabolism
LSFLDYSDSCSIFGNAIDNALTACKQLRAVNKPAELFVQISRQQKIAAITIRNDILPGSIIYQNEHFISTKTDSRFHGYGIPIMKATINRIGGSILIDYDENQFTLSILLMEH